MIMVTDTVRIVLTLSLEEKHLGLVITNPHFSSVKILF